MRMCDPAPIAGIVVFLCGLGMVASALGSAEPGVGTVRLHGARPTAGAQPFATQSPVGICPGTAQSRQALICDADLPAGASADRGVQDDSLLLEESFTRVEDTRSAVSGKHYAWTDMRHQFMGAANLARHRMEPGVWITGDGVRQPHHSGDQ
jgi:hypothetical protein